MTFFIWIIDVFYIEQLIPCCYLMARQGRASEHDRDEIRGSKLVIYIDFIAVSPI